MNNYWTYAASTLGILSAVQGYVGVIPVDPVTSSGLGALVAVAIFVLRLVLKKKPVA